MKRECPDAGEQDSVPKKSRNGKDRVSVPMPQPAPVENLLYDDQGGCSVLGAQLSGDKSESSNPGVRLVDANVDVGAQLGVQIAAPRPVDPRVAFALGYTDEIAPPPPVDPRVAFALGYTDEIAPPPPVDPRVAAVMALMRAFS
jgi:hypothetical protein